MARRLRIHGFVQGVCYRESMRAEAARLGVTGWVRNRLDGTVEAMVDGPPGAVAAMIAWAREGPPAARVERVVVELAEETFSGFRRYPTA